jgi:formylglycine-generating enzyme required for sulfatase activity
MVRQVLAYLLYLFVIGLFFAGPSVGTAQERKDREFQECHDCPIMVGVPAGKYVMGSPPQEAGRFDTEGPQHTVSIRAFALSKYPVTSEEFLKFLRETGYQPAPCNPTLNRTWHVLGPGLAYPPLGPQPPRWPASCLDWHDAEAYIAWLNEKARQDHPTIAPGAGPYRLPSEAEWEYAARAGTTTARWWGDAIGTNNANCNGCGSPWDDREYAEVDSFKPNAFGLYGMLGNVWQWTADCWHPNYVDAPHDEKPWKTGDCNKRVIRGGSDRNLPVFIRSATRSAGLPSGTEYDYSSSTGFRVARNLP